MASDPKPLTRDQLAKFLPDAEAIKRFERLFAVAGDLTPTDVATLYRLTQEASIDAGIADSKAQMAMDILLGAVKDAAINAGAASDKASEALSVLSSIAKSLEVLAKAPPAQADNSVRSDYVDFSLSPRYSRTPGRVHWGQTGTLEIEMGGGNITQQVGEEFFAYGKATADIADGQLVMVTGAVGSSGVITFSPTSTGLLDPNAILGVATESIPLNSFGRVTTMGIVRGIDTTGSAVGETWSDGDVLWYNASFVGGMTKVKPSAPNMKTQVAIVINAGSGGSGSLQVEVVHGSTLGGTDSNVQLGALSDKQLLQYDSTLGYWKNVASSSVVDIAGLTHAATSKVTPVDTDELPIVDSASSFSLKKLTWANIKSTLAAWINGGNIPASLTSLSVTGNTTLGSAAASRLVLIDGINSGVGGGSNLQVRNAGVPIVAIGNKSSLVGGAYNATPTLYGNPSIEINLGGTTYGSMTPSLFNYVGPISSGGLITGGSSTFLIASSVTLANGAGASVGTINNAPVAGNPTKWIQINDNGVTRRIPAW